MPRHWRPQWAVREYFLGSHLFVDNLQPLQDLLVAQGEQGNMLNEGRVTEVEQTGIYMTLIKIKYKHRNIFIKIDWFILFVINC